MLRCRNLLFLLVLAAGAAAPPGARAAAAADEGIRMARVASGASDEAVPDHSPDPALRAPAAPGRVDRPLHADEQAWVDATVARLPLRRKVAQLVMPRIHGDFLSVGGPQYEALRVWITELGVGGVIITIGPPLEQAAKLNTLQRLADVPLLVTADMEHGPGAGLRGGTVLPYGFDTGSATRFPPAMALAATDDPELAYALGAVTALEARAAGVHVNFAPVADVNNNPANPIVNTRSYGADPAAAARFVTAHLRGLQEHGMLAVAKHFPGHGDTDTDSHVELPTIRADRARADAVELVPFRAAIDAGVGGIMSAHVAFPALTGNSIPATLSPALLTGLLREELGFDGLVFTDGMDMGAIRRGWASRRAAVLALTAGADVLLQVPGPDVAIVIDAVTEAVRAGELAESRIDAALRRVLAAKARAGLHEERLVELDRLGGVVGAPAHRALAAEAAACAITLVRDRDELLPIAGRSLLSVVYTDDFDPFAGRALQATLSAALPEVRTAAIHGRTTAAELAALLEAADGAEVVLFAPVITVSAAKEGLALPEAVAAWLRDVAARRPTIVASLGNPYLLDQFPGLGTYVLAWAGWEPVQGAAARALLGHAAVGGRLPIPLPPHYEIGDGVQRPARVPPAGSTTADTARFAVLDSIVRAALADGAAPGAAVAVGRADGTLHMRGYGRLDPRAEFAAVDDSTIYDLASLTKVMATTTLAMMLVDDGVLDLDAPVARYLPEWAGEDRAVVTVRSLLVHDAGLQPFAALFNELRGRDEYVRRIVSIPLEYEPGTRTLYSDWGPILLGIIMERLTGKPLDALLAERLTGPLGLADTGYNPVGVPVLPAPGARAPASGPAAEAQRRDPRLARIAPTEIDTVLRHGHVHGTVHDENAAALGGVAGHAGLFGSARDLARFARMMLNGGTLDGRQYVRPETIEAFTRPHSSASTRAIGWDTPAPNGSAGSLVSDRAYGHTGFTGTSLWIDPANDLFVILLTNRVNPTRANSRHVPLRRAVADAAARAILDNDR